MIYKTQLFPDGSMLWSVTYKDVEWDSDARMQGPSPTSKTFYILAKSKGQALDKAKEIRAPKNAKTDITAQMVTIEDLVPVPQRQDNSTLYGKLTGMEFSHPEDKKKYKFVVAIVEDKD